MSETFETQLAKYAEVIVRIGLNLQAGQRLMIRSGKGLDGVPLEAYPLVRAVAKAAYKAGSPLVAVSWDDEELQRIRVEQASLESMSQTANWKHDVAIDYIDNGDAILSVSGRNPDLLGGLDPEKIQRKQRAETQQSQAYSARIAVNATNWLVAAAPVSGWAASVFPDLPLDEAMARLWTLIFAACRVDQPDPVASWKQHLAGLAKRTAYLDAKRYTALHYRGPGTDLTLGLADGHLWMGGGITAQNDVYFVPNLPTEEVFSMPHRHHIEGVVQSTKPLSYGGSLIKNFTLRFEGGRVVNSAAEVGQDALDTLLNTDDGSRSLGEVALVPHSSPISQSGVLFNNTLFDENASCHLALGRAYRFTMAGGVVDVGCGL